LAQISDQIFVASVLRLWGPFGGGDEKARVIAVIAGTAVIWPVALHAQQGDRLHSIGVLSFFAQDDPQGKIYDVAFRKRLNALGWVEGRNLEIQPRWAAGDLGSR
jgi:putative tryptophan/tyrosine transport system substrate-binding protein